MILVNTKYIYVDISKYVLFSFISGHIPRKYEKRWHFYWIQQFFFVLSTWSVLACKSLLSSIWIWVSVTLQVTFSTIPKFREICTLECQIVVGLRLMFTYKSDFFENVVEK